MKNKFSSKMLFFVLFFFVGIVGFFSTINDVQAIDYWLVPLDLTHPPNAEKAYLYGTPIYTIPQPDLHFATYRLNDTHTLNYYAFYYNLPERIYPIGIDETGDFLLVMVESSGQIGWIPKIQISNPNFSVAGMRLFQMNNMPDYYNTYK